MNTHPRGEEFDLRGWSLVKLPCSIGTHSGLGKYYCLPDFQNVTCYYMVPCRPTSNSSVMQTGTA